MKQLPKLVLPRNTSTFNLLHWTRRNPLVAAVAPVENHAAVCLLAPFLAPHVLIFLQCWPFFLLSECICHRLTKSVHAVSDAVSLEWLAATRTSRPFAAKTGCPEAKQPTRAERLSCPPCGQPPTLENQYQSPGATEGGAGRSR